MSAGKSLASALFRIALEKLLGGIFFVIIIFIYHYNFHREVEDASIPVVAVDEPQCVHFGDALTAGQQSVLAAATPVIRKWEGLRLDTYDDNGARAVGYGHHLSGDDIHLKSVTRETAECFLSEDVREIVHFLDATLPDAGLNTNEEAALVSWIYNVGPGAARRSHLFEVIQAGELQRVPRELRRWVHVDGVVSQGLEARREDEIRLFNQPVAKP